MPMTPKNLQITLEGKGPITLRPSDHVATGGEGSIYKIGDSVVKIYTNPDEMRQRDIPSKINLLKNLKHTYIVAPNGLATNPKNEPVGFYMPYVEGHPLSRVFTNDFYNLQKFTKKHASTLIDRMRETVSFAHQHKATLVDANELNWIVILNKEPEPRIVDVDSWAISRWPATVIMPSIRDWHSKTFDEKTDWFAWGIVTFQIYTGLHPYKGTLDGFDRGDLEGRMKSNASVFSSGVRFNRAVRDFSCIPGKLLNWYEATFQKGERVLPPSPFDTGISTPRAALIMRTVTTKTGTLIFEKILETVNDPAIRIFHCGIALLSSGNLIDLNTKRTIATASSLFCEIIKVDKGWVLADRENGEFKFKFIEEGSLKTENLSIQINGRRILSYENRLFIVTESGLTEIVYHNLGKPIVSASQTWGVMVNSTKWFNSGVGVQDAMGAMFIVTPFGDKSVATTRVKEIDKIQIVAAKSGNRFVSMIGVDKKGSYRKFELTFDKEYKTYKIWDGRCDSAELNIAILPKGVCATIIEDGELDIFVPTNGTLNRIEDKNIATDMILANWGDRVMYIQNGNVWGLRVK